MKLPQKKSKKFAKWIPAILLPVVMVLFAWNSFMIPDNLTLIEGQKYEYKTLLPVSTSIEGDGSKVVVKAFGERQANRYKDDIGRCPCNRFYRLFVE